MHLQHFAAHVVYRVLVQIIPTFPTLRFQKTQAYHISHHFIQL